MTDSRPTVVMEEDDQAAKMSQLNISGPSAPESECAETITQTGRFFFPGVRDRLVQILNQLDSISFVKFSRTCKTMHDFCFNTPGIQVHFGRREDYYNDEFDCRIAVQIPRASEADIRLSVRHRSHRISFNSRFLSEEKLKSLLKTPFVVIIREMSLHSHFNEEINSRVLENLSAYLRRFHHVLAEKVDMSAVNYWNSFIQFIQEFRVKNVIIRYGRHEVLPVESLSFFLKELDEFDYYRMVPDKLILSATSKRLDLRGASISPETFKELVMRFRAGFIHNWKIGLDWPEEDIDDYFFDEDYEDGEDEEEELDLDPFMEACSEVMEVVSVKEIDFLNMKPSVIYTSSESIDPKYFMLKSDGSVGEFSVYKFGAFFG